MYQVKYVKKVGMCVKNVRYDNAGEINKFVERVNSAAWKLDVKMELKA